MYLEEILSNSGIVPSPGFYAGRGATLSDLNSKKLNKVADGIKKQYGEEAHSSFVAMVWEMKILSATAFITNVYILARSGWKFNKKNITNKDSHFERNDQALAVIAAVLCKKNKNDIGHTDEIRKAFRKNLN